MSFPFRAAAMLLLGAGSLAAAPASAQHRVIPGVVRDGKIVTRIHVTFYDTETRYLPVVAHPMLLVSEKGDSLRVTTDEAGVVTLLLEPGRYVLRSVESTMWKGKPFYWNIDVAVEAGMELVDLTPYNSTPGPVPRIVAAPPPPPQHPTAPTQRFTFANIPWGVRGDSARYLLAGYGYPYVGLTDDGGLRFRGMVDGYPAQIGVTLLAGLTARVEVDIFTPEGSAARALESIRSQVARRYGSPFSEVAVQSAGVPARLVWRNGEAADAESLSLDAPDARTVRVIYESSAWRRVVTRALSR
jgi:hypothetical protein